MEFDAKLAATIDHTVLKAGTVASDVSHICEEAEKYGFAAVCVPPVFVPQAAELLNGSLVKVATVVGFPLSYQTLASKIFEAEDAIQNGANEIDWVVNLSWLKSGNWEKVDEEIGAAAELVKEAAEAVSIFGEEVLLKVIIETEMLTGEEIKKVVQICINHQVDFVKTSTGFNAAGASIENVQLLRTLLPPEIRIKASGGIKTPDFARKLLDAGADRLGCSASLNIIGV